MAVLKQREINGERRVFRDKLTDQYYFKAQKEIPVCLVCSEKTSSIPSVDRLVRDMKCQSSHALTASRPPNASANQLDIFQFVANRN